MLKALIYKEWLKIRWAALITLAVFLLVLVKMTLYMSYTIRIVGANSFWNDVFIRGLLYFDDLLYIPVVTGIVIAAFQFFPEITENRLKLTLHLPMRENSILMHMAIMGASVVLSITALSYLVLCIITVFYFPSLVLTVHSSSSTYTW